MADKDKPAGVNGAAGEDHATSPQDSTESNIYGAHMLPQHAALLAASAISPEVAAARGYRSVETKADLERKGFSRAQRNVPGLLIPIYDSTGEFATYQYRPDEPRVKEGKAIKYETPSGSHMVIDVPRDIRDMLGDPKRPLWITEGSRKADAAVSIGLCCIAVLGVWNRRGTNDQGGKTALADWELIALNGRDVYITFDSDVMEKRQVYGALVRLKAFLHQRGAHDRLIYFPAGDGGTKTGLDDYLAAGHGVDDLLALATTELRSPPRDERENGGPYRATAVGLFWDKPTGDGTVPIPLTNFTATIAADVVEDDGVEVSRRFEIAATLRERIYKFTIPAARFQGMGWATEYLGAGAIVYPGFGTKDHARAAVQHLSGEVPERRVYTHTGWRQIDGKWMYLHAGGAICSDGPADGVEVALPGHLTRYVLPEPQDGEELVAAVRASLMFLELAPDRITVPLYGADWRAAIESTDLTIHVAGPTGAGKSELAALVQQHYGAGMDARHLPASWSSTGNSLEITAFHIKDSVLVVDDFAPTGASGDVARAHRDADRLVRAQGNRSGRSRLRPDGTLRSTKAPRGLTVSTGEDVPRGQSLRARMLVLELGPDDLAWPLLRRCQTDAANGLYSQAMAGYVRWIAARYDYISARFKDQVVEIRQRAAESRMHRRTPDIVANLWAGLACFVMYARSVGAVTEDDAKELLNRFWDALGEAAAAQAQHQAASEPARHFLEMVSAAVAAGKAHLAATDGGEPDSPGSWGWRQAIVGAGDFTRREWRPQGVRIGWLEGADLTWSRTRRTSPLSDWRKGWAIR